MNPIIIFLLSSALLGFSVANGGGGSPGGTTDGSQDGDYVLEIHGYEVAVDELRPLVGDKEDLAVALAELYSDSTDASLKAVQALPSYERAYWTMIRLTPGETTVRNQQGELLFPTIWDEQGRPTEWTTRGVGLKVSVGTEVVDPDIFSLDLSIEHSRLEAWVGSGATNPRCLQPILSMRAINTQITTKPGLTLRLGGLTRESVTTDKDGRSTGEIVVFHQVITLHQSKVLADGLLNIRKPERKSGTAEDPFGM